MDHTSVDIYLVIDTFLLLLIGIGPKIALVPFLELTGFARQAQQRPASFARCSPLPASSLRDSRRDSASCSRDCFISRRDRFRSLADSFS